MQEIAYRKTDEFESDHFWFVGREKICLSLIEKLIRRQSLRILDYGCGTGHMIATLKKKYPEMEIHGCDVSVTALEYCRKRHLTDLIDLNIDQPEQDHYDLILCLDVLEHAEDDAALLADLHGYLVTGGTLLITVPAFDFLWSGEDFISDHFRRYNIKMLRNLILNSGLRIIRISYYNFWLFFPYVFILLIKRIFRPRSMYESDLKKYNPHLNRVLAGIFSSEKWILQHFRFPFGGSIIASAGKGHTH